MDEFTPAENPKHFMGRPCKHGHSGLRYTNSKGGCVECQTVRNNKPGRAEYAKQWAGDNADHVKAMKNEYNRANRAAVNATKNEWKRRMRAAQGPEKRIEEYLKNRVEDAGGFCPKFVSPGMRGAPDRLVIFSGHPTYYVEMKQPLGTLEELQKAYHAKLRQHGQRVWTLWTRQSVDDFMTEILI